MIQARHSLGCIPVINTDPLLATSSSDFLQTLIEDILFILLQQVCHSTNVHLQHAVPVQHLTSSPLCLPSSAFHQVSISGWKGF
jgi:hypothetical protein